MDKVKWGSGEMDVLVVDDNPDDRALVRRALERGFEPIGVTEVGTAGGLREALGADPMTVVITDYDLGWGTGLDVLQQVQVRWPQCAIIMFTDSGNEEVAARAMRDGLDDYLVKSADRAERLPVAVRRALDRRMQRKRARAAETQIRELFDRLPAGVYRANMENRVLYANQALADIAGVDGPQVLIGMDLSESLVDPEDTKARRVAKAEGSYTSTVQLRRPGDGEMIWVRDSGRLVRDVDGTPMYYEGVLQDVTEVHEAEIEVRRQSSFVELLQAVTATANEYDTLDEALTPALVIIRRALDWPVGHVYRADGNVLKPTDIWTDDGSGRFASFRQATAETEFRVGEGLPGRALAAQATAWMNSLAGNTDFIRIQPEHDEAFGTGAAVPVMFGDQVVAVLEFFHTEARTRDEALIRVLDKAGVQLGRVAEREAAEEARREMEAAAREAQRLDAVGRLAGGIAHDFNNLLTVIQSQTELILMDLAGEDPLTEEIGAIQMAADRAAGLTSQLLAFSRKQALKHRVVHLNEVVADVAQLLDRIIGEDITVVRELADDLPPIEIDPTQLEQVLVNLAVNARHAMPDGGTFTLSSEPAYVDDDELPDLPAGRYVTLRVRDTGIGMDPETRERIFEPFFTTKEEGEGSGLGLAMAHGILKQSGGAIHVESEPGQGATFFLRFPPSERAPEPIGDEEEDADTYERTVDTGRVLLVEDEAAVRNMIEKALVRAGFSVRAVPDAEQAVTALDDDEPFDLLLTDLLLPGMTGTDLAWKLRDHRAELPVVVMSGYTQGKLDQDDRGLPDGSTFIQKPFTIRDLVKTARAALNVR